MIDYHLINEEFDKRKSELKKVLALLVRPKQSNGKIAYLANDTDFPKPGTIRFRKLNKKRNELENSLLKTGTKRIEFIENGKKIWYELGKDKYGLNQKEEDRVSKLKDLSYKIDDKPKQSTDIVKFTDKDKYKKQPTPDLPPIKDVVGGDKKDYKYRFLPNKDYDIRDIVNIITPNAKFKSVYMGIEGGDVQDILDKLNPQFEKADPFDGVFVLFTDNLPKSFLQKGVRIFLFNENKIGKGKQIIKAYTNDGKFITKYKVTINAVELVKKQEMPSKIAASLRIPIGPSLLETINSEEFQQIINMKNETLHFKDFNTDIDFEEINENFEEEWDVEEEDVSPLTKNELNKLKKLKIGIEPGEIRTRENPEKNGMPLCNIYKDKENIKIIYGKNQEEISKKVLIYLREYLKKI